MTYVACPVTAANAGTTTAAPTGLENCAICYRKHSGTTSWIGCARCQPGNIQMMDGCYDPTDSFTCISNEIVKNCD